MEIGSFYEIDPKQPGNHFWSDKEFVLEEVKKYGRANTVFTASAREALLLVLKSYAQQNSGIQKICLMPAYMCDSVFTPFAWEEWKLVFYHTDRNLKPDFGEIKRQVEEYHPDMVFIHSYYGADTWKEARDLLRKWRREGICVTEDVTQSYYLKTAGQDVDYVIGSLRKWYAIPDGGFVTTDRELFGEFVSKSDDFAEKKLEVMIQKWRYLNEDARNWRMKDRFLRENRALEEGLDSVGRIRNMSHIARSLLSQIEEEYAKKKRADNLRILKSKISGNPEIVPATSEGAAIYLPVFAKNRNGLQAFLAERGIYAPTLWPVGKENRNILSEDEKYIYSHILALPIDWRYGEREMCDIADTLNQWRNQN